MATSFRVPMATITLLIIAFLLFTLDSSEAQIGVSYGGSGNNLPSKQQVVNLYRSNGIQRMRIYWPDQDMLRALQGSGIQLLLDVPNDQLQSIAQDYSQAQRWIQANVVPYASFIRYIVVGNEVPQWVRQYVGPALWNIQNSLNAANLGQRIKVSTSISMEMIKNSYPPSAGEFTDLPFMDPIAYFLNYNGSPLMVNIYPYFTYANGNDVSLDYALFTSPGTVVTDWNNGLRYQNLFDAQADSVYAALSKRGVPNIKLLSSETGWPKAGGKGASKQNAGTYYRNMINHAPKGTPLKPWQPIETYLFAMFDENQKPGPAVEQNFGLFTPDMQPKYDNIYFGSKVFSPTNGSVESAHSTI